jgi:hypothetical protein
MRDGTWIGQAGGLDQDRVKAVASFSQLRQYPNQIATYRAADAAVTGFKDFLVGTDHQFVIHTDFAEFVLDHSNAFAMVLRQNAVDQRRLAGTEKSRQHRDRYPICHESPLGLTINRPSPGRRSTDSSTPQPARTCSGTDRGGTAANMAAAASR